MRIQIIQHSAADAPAAISPILDRLGHQASIVRIDRGEPIPQSVEGDVLMMFGGGISLTTGVRPVWVEPELELIRRYADQGLRVVGICLGAQLLASALGATVQRNREPEVGWHQVWRVEDLSRSKMAAVLPQAMTTFHWHQDTFGIPAGAVRLYESEGCQNQAFVVDDRLFGFQFHFEANERTVRTFLAVSKLWHRQERYIQSETEITAGIEKYLPAQNRHLEVFLATLLPAEID